MDKTKSKLAAFFDNDEEESSFPPKTVDNQKLSQYTQGTVRKSRKEKEKEAADVKKREEEEEAARAYAEFIDAFEGGDTSKRRAGGAFVRAESKAAYAPSVALASENVLRPSSALEEPEKPIAPKPKGKRAMDAFLEEIKREQAEREARYGRHAHGRSVTAMAAYEGQTGSKDRGDGETSNLFVANLPPHVTEASLGKFFASKGGPVGSVKIMWPRGDIVAGPGGDMTASRKNKNAGLSGFVSFMKRKDAEAALRELDGFEWGGSVLRVGWSKAVPIAAKPLYTAEKSASPERESRRERRKSSYSRSRSRSRSPSRDRSRRHRSSRKSRSRSWSRSRSPSRDRYGRSGRPLSRSPSRDQVVGVARALNEEEEAVTDGFIRAVAAEVKGHDTKYEASLRERERNNPKYTFLTNKNHRRHAFYRGLVERDDAGGTEFDDEGYNSVYSTDSAEESERERQRKTSLGKLARKRFEAMLRALSGKRGELARCMTFCLEHAEAASEVADIVVASLLVEETPVPRKVARLHLICDILHNSAAPVPSAWKFRQEFQSRLGIVFDHLSTIYHSFPGRITAETFKKQITAVVDIWEDWIVFSPDFTAELRVRLDGSSATEAEPQKEDTKDAPEANSTSVSSRFKSSSFRPASPEALNSSHVEGDGLGEEAMDQDSDVDGEPVDDVDGEPINDLDGEPLEDGGIDGEPIEDNYHNSVDADIDGVSTEDVDGEPMDADVDGEPMAEDIDGDPIVD